MTRKRKTAYSSTYPNSGVSHSKDSFVVNGSLVFQIKFAVNRPPFRYVSGIMSYIKFLILFAIPAQLMGQSILSVYEDSLKTLQHDLYSANDDKIKLEINNKLKLTFERALLQSKSFDYSFDSLKEIGRVVSPDKKIKIISWDLPLKDGTFAYFGFIQIKEEKSKPQKLFTLIDKSLDIQNYQNHIGNTDKWYGMLYYKIIPVKVRRKVYYTLLGSDGNDKLSSKKIIDVLSFTSNGIPQFGANVFKMEKKSLKRVVFEYSSSAVMTLNYDDNQKRIMFDHLSPSKSNFEGQYQYYGPDFSFDAFELKKGKWIYLPDVDARNKKSPKDNTYNDPKDKTKDYDNKLFYEPKK